MTHVFPLLLSLATALSLVLAPIFPGIALADRVDTGNAVHAAHGADDGGHAYHAPHHGSATDETQSPCAQHDGCQGQCCATCVQCFAGTTPLAAVSSDARPVQTPTVHTLLDSLLITFLNRPPSAV